MTRDDRPAGAGHRAPPPTTVRYNDWRSVPTSTARDAPPVAVSVVVPYFEAPRQLACTLAGLERQDYPRTSFEVIVVDDGSRAPWRRPADSPLDVRTVRQPHRGFGLARARNRGARAARHDVLVFLDCDVVPEPGLLAAHAHWHRAAADALTLGACRFAAADHVDAERLRRHRGALETLFDRGHDEPWALSHLARTADLTTSHGDLFRALVGGNFGIRRAFYRALGGCDETFTRYGGEDTEFAYRAYNRGGLLIPAPGALGWHLGRWQERDRAGKERDKAAQRARLANLIPDPAFRPPAPGRIYAVPAIVATVAVGAAPPAAVQRTVDALLGDAAGDLAACVRVAADTPTGRVLAARFGADPRVRLGAGLDAARAFPNAPLHVRVPAGAELGAAALAGMAGRLGRAVQATVDLGDDRSATLTRAWALHRSRRTGRPPAAFGDTTVLRRRRPRRRRAMPASPSPHAAGWRAAAHRVLQEAAGVRGPRSGWRFLRWFAHTVRFHRRARRALAAADPARRPPPGVAVAALGPQAQAVFGAPAGGRGRAPPRADVVVADTADDALGVHAPVVVLDRAPALAVPAFDPRRYNPRGWARNVERRAAAFGPRDRLPADAPKVARAPTDAAAAWRRRHHLEDVAAFHGGAVARAGRLVRAAATGLPVHLADGGAGLEALLGPELHGLMTVPGIRTAGLAERERTSIRQRRAALRDHTLRARVRQLGAAALDAPPLPPRVSILLATRRPANLAWALGNVTRQNYPRLELVLALHGRGFEPPPAPLPFPVHVVRCAATMPLGAVLNAAADAATGVLVAKMDDDDLYGPDHIWDLVLAHEYSGAQLVGKFAETVYLRGPDRTVARGLGGGETGAAAAVAGPALLIARDDLYRAGGWRPLPCGEDAALADDVRRIGGGVYRTHGAGLVLVRDGGDHAWRRDAAAFLAEADAVHAGCRAELASIAPALGAALRRWLARPPAALPGGGP